MAKMCEHIMTCKARMFGYRPNLGYTCCKGKNDTCEIVPKKPKDKVVKAWFEGDIIGDNFTIFTKASAAKRWGRPMSPCTIHIKAADWKKIRGER